MLVIIELIQTLLPAPVCPAISKCGIFERSAIIAVPVISFPNPTDTGDLLSLNRLLSSTSRSVTMEIVSLGISIPIADFPGIGASIRTPTADMESAISSARERIRLTRVPFAIESSYRVIAGPTVIFSTQAVIPKLFKVDSIISIFWEWSVLRFFFGAAGGFKSESGGA